MGLISALGTGVEENRLSLLQGISGLRPMSTLDSVFQKLAFVGEIPFNNAELKGISHQFSDDDYYRSLYMAGIAVNEILADLPVNRKNIHLFTGTTTAGVTKTEQEYKRFIFNQAIPSRNLASLADCGSINRILIEKYQFANYNYTISTACSSASNAILMAAQRIKSGQLDFAICGGVDSLSLFTLNGFNSLKNMSLEPCKPFDKYRSGLNLGEAAAYILICNAELASKWNLEPMAILSGGGNANESYHMTGSDPAGAGAQAAMQKALNDAHLNAAEINYINAHGTATLDNDIAEGNAIKSIFGSNASFSSTKAYTGHTLAASGAVNLIFSLLGMQEGIVWANLGFSEPDETHMMVPVLKNSRQNMNHIMVNSFGFGGNNTSIIISKV